MVRNSVIGLVIIAAIILGYSIFFGPTPEERAVQQQIQDSIAQVEEKNPELETPVAEAPAPAQQDTIQPVKTDSLGRQIVDAQSRAEFGIFAPAVNSPREFAFIETEL